MTRQKDMLRVQVGFEVIEAQMDRWRRAQAGHEKWAEMAALCTQFFEGEQWTAQERAKLADEGRPCITKNKIAPLVRLLLGYFRQNRYDSNVLPGNDAAATQEIAEILTATLKQIAEMNQSEWHDAEVMQDGLICGRGFWDSRLSFDKNILGEVKESVLDPFSVYIDPEADTYDPEGWGFVMVNRWMSPADIFLLYGDAGLEEVDSLGAGTPITTSEYMNDGTGSDVSPSRFFAQTESFIDDHMSALRLYSSPFDHVNRFRKLVRVLDCQHRMLKKVRTFVDLRTGMEKIIPDEWPREKIQRIIEWAQLKGLPLAPRENLKKVVRWTVTAGDRTLHDKWSPYDDISITPFFPYFRRGKTRGMIEDLIDPQREINRRSAAMLHIIMTTANSGWLSEENSMEEDMERALEEQGSAPGIHVKYREGYNAPQRIEPAAPPSAMKDLVITGENDLKEISGINDSALGNLDRVQSGRAIQARQQQSIVGAEVYFDNFSRSRELKARRQLSIVQNFYTEPRLVRIRSGDIATPNEDIYLNRQEAAGQIVNNVTLGVYDVAVESAPVSDTFMQGQFQEALELLEKGIPIPPDVLIDLSSMPSKGPIKKRMEEQRLIEESNKRMESLGLRLQAGLQPDQPVPPVPVDNGPAVVVVSAPPAADAGSSLPAPDAPIGGMTGTIQPLLPAPSQEAVTNALPRLERPEVA